MRDYYVLLIVTDIIGGSTMIKQLPNNGKFLGLNPATGGDWHKQDHILFFHYISNGRGSTINRALDGSTYLG